MTCYLFIIVIAIFLITRKYLNTSILIIFTWLLIEKGTFSIYVLHLYRTIFSKERGGSRSHN